MSIEKLTNLHMWELDAAGATATPGVLAPVLAEAPGVLAAAMASAVLRMVARAVLRGMGAPPRQWLLYWASM